MKKISGTRVKGLIPNETALDWLADLNSAIIEEIPAPLYVCDMDRRMIYYNKAAANLWGWKPSLGEDYRLSSWKIYRPDGSSLSAEDCPMSVALKEQRPVVGEELIIERPDGDQVYVQPNPRPLFNTSGQMVGVINLLIDITDKKKSEQAIKESETRYRLLAESLEKKVEERTETLKESEERYHKMIEEVQDYAILLLDCNGFIMNWNQGAEKIKGYTEKEIIGKNFRIFYLEEDRKNLLPEKLIKQALETGRAQHEGWRLRKDGSRFWGSVVITALHDDDNNIIGFSKLTRDLTERKLAEDQAKIYAMDIEFRNKQLEEYAYIASHDLQEPLRKIQVFGELLERNLDNKDVAKRYVDKINSSARRMTQLIKGVLKYSQLSRNEELLEDIDLNITLKNVVADFDLLIEEKNAEIIVHNLPKLKGIAIQQHQLFSNLIANSIKFSEKNPVIEITAGEPTKAEIDEAGLHHLHRYTKIIFKDNGVGFEQQYSPQIFRMFKRLSDAQGTGIGLALCKKIVDNHNGHISVISAPGKGTTFTIILPIE